jgi:hypothetical protein
MLRFCCTGRPADASLLLHGETSGCFASVARGDQRMLRFCCTGRPDVASLFVPWGSQQMLRFCFMGEGEQSHKEASKAHLEYYFHTASFLLPSPLVGDRFLLAPLSPGGRGAGGEGVVLKQVNAGRTGRAPLRKTTDFQNVTQGGTVRR